MGRAEKMRSTIPAEEYVYSGHTACPGCGSVLAMRYTLKALGPKTTIALTASCWSAIAGTFPYTALSVPVLHCAFATGAVTASGIKAGLDMRHDTETTVVAWAGDGGTFDIGMQSLSGVAERNEDILFICNDNEAYMNTGVQRSSATPMHASTTTTPKNNPKSTHKKDLMGIMAAHHIPYAATACIAYPEDLIAKVKKARGMRGTKLIHILAPCPPGWGFASNLTIKIARSAVEANVFPLYEVENGKYTVTFRPDKVKVKDYLAAQGRFKHVAESSVHAMQRNVDKDWEQLLVKAGLP
jgi:pyruvate/2-oxoacid:ferredoxin oxidoreductase beta subunit